MPTLHLPGLIGALQSLEIFELEPSVGAIHELPLPMVLQLTKPKV